MLIKWINCRVPQSKRDAFSEAQRAWRALSDVEGFRGQIGGWNADDPSEACIIGLWAHYGAERNFMNDVHDSIVESSGQDALYDAARTDRFAVMLETAGSAGSITEACERAAMLRVTECRVHFNRQAHFVQSHQETAAPALQAVDGMLRAWLCRSDDDPTHFLTIEWWRDRDADEQLERRALPDLHAAASNDVRSLEETIIAPDPGWWVPAAGS